VVADLRTDHAGETGAICITTGCCVSKTRNCGFCTADLATESPPAANRSLAFPSDRSALLPVWRLAGWLTGALPALLAHARCTPRLKLLSSLLTTTTRRRCSLQDQPALQPLGQTLLVCQATKWHTATRSAAGGPQRLGAGLRLWCGLARLAQRSSSRYI
jgi:ubiquinone biosynthesis monooxygenase Coq7